MKTNLIKKAIDDAVNSGVVCGISAALITQDDNDIYLKGVMGTIAPYSDRSLTYTMQYDMASCTKVVSTTTRLMQLIEEGKLNLEDRVSDYLERFKHKDVRIKNLLLHNSGLPSDMLDKRSLTKENIINRIYEVDLVNKVGEVMAYSDIGFILLGFIINKIDNKTLADTYYEHILKPLKMTNSTYHPNIDKSIPTEISPSRGLVVAEPHDTKAYLLGDKCASAGLFSTIEDITLFVRSMLYGENPILHKDSIDLLVNTDIMARSYGWDKKYHKKILYHTGFTGTSIMIDYDRAEAIVLLTNRVHPKRDNDAYIAWRNDLNEKILNN